MIVIASIRHQLIKWCFAVCDNETPQMTLLTEAEVAQILGCSRSKVKNLRLGRRITYIPGRPVLIDRADLDSFIELDRAERAAKEEMRKPVPMSPQMRAELSWLQMQTYRLSKAKVAKK